MKTIIPKQFQIPDGWRILQDGEAIRDGDRYFAEKAYRTEEDYLNGSTNLDRWDISFSIGHVLESDKIHNVYITKL